MSSTRTLYVNKECTVADASGLSVGNAVTGHTNVGTTSYGWLFRAFVRTESDWSNITELLSARFYVKITPGYHQTVGSSIRLNFKRCGETFQATGGNSHGSGSEFATDANEDWDSMATVSLVGSTYDDTASEADPESGDWVYFDITNIYQQYIDGETNYGFRVWAFDEASATDEIEWYSMRSGYEPYVLLTYNTVGTFGTATPTAPTNGQVLEGEPSTVAFSFADSSPSVAAITSYDLSIGTFPGDNSILSSLGSVVGITGRTVSRDVSALTFPPGPIYVEARAKNSIGNWGAYGYWGFNVKGPPSVPTLISPTAAKPYARIHNLADLAIWTSAEAKPEVDFTYTHPQGYAAINTELSIGGVVTSYVTPAASGAVISIDASTAMVRNTATAFLVRVQATGGQWSAWTTVFNAKVNWAQGLYPHTHPAGASSFEFASAALAGGAYAQMATIFRKGDGTPGAWKTSVGEVTPGTQMDVLVRLATGDSTQAPTLPDMSLSYNATPEPQPDNWVATGATLSIDTTRRRFGRRSIKVLPSGAGNIRALLASGALVVTAGIEYTWSIYVNTLLATLAQSLILKVTDSAGVVIATAGAEGTTVDSSAYPDGWQRLTMTFTPMVTSVIPQLTWAGTTAEFRVDSAQLEEGSRATQWRPGASGTAVSLDVGGVQVDASLGAVFRLRGSSGGIRDVVTLGAKGLDFADVEVYSDAADVLTVNGAIALPTDGRIVMDELAADPATPAANAWGLYHKAAGLYSIDDAGVVIAVAHQGTAFPASPIAGQRFYRTDLQMEFVRFGSIWVSTQLFQLPLEPWTDAPLTATDTFASVAPAPSLQGGSDLWLVKLTVQFLISAGGSALSGSHKWVGVFNKGLANDTNVALVTVTINSGASGSWRTDEQNIGALLNAGSSHLSFKWAGWTKTGTPGNIYNRSILTYRIVAT